MKLMNMYTKKVWYETHFFLHLYSSLNLHPFRAYESSHLIFVIRQAAGVLHHALLGLPR